MSMNVSFLYARQIHVVKFLQFALTGNYGISARDSCLLEFLHTELRRYSFFRPLICSVPSIRISISKYLKSTLLISSVFD
jgi:hypothetical protein